MYKRTLKMLKHFLHKDSDRPVVTLYRGGKGDVLDVQMLLFVHFGPEAVLPKVFYHHDVVTELAPPKAQKKLIRNTNFSFSAPIGNAKSSHYQRERTTI